MLTKNITLFNLFLNMLKKSLFLLLFLPLMAIAQRQTGATNFTPQWNFKVSGADTIYQIGNTSLNAWPYFQNKYQSDKTYIPRTLSSTGVITGGIGSVASATTVNITAGSGQVLDNTNPASPTYKTITWNAYSGVALASTSPANTWWYIDSLSTLQQTQVAPTAASYRTRIWLFNTVYTGGTITPPSNISVPVQQVAPAVRDLAKVFGTMRVSGGSPTSSGANLKLKVTAASLYRFGSNRWTSAISPDVKPYVEFDSGVSDVFRYFTSAGVIASDVTDIDVSHYQLAGVVTLVPNPTSNYSVTYIWVLDNGNVRASYSTEYFGTQQAALASLNTIDPYTTVPAALKGAAFCYGAVIAQKSATNLAASGTFITTNFLGLFGGGIANSGGDFLIASNNLSDVASPTTALSNLGGVPTTRLVSTGYGLLGGGNLGANLTLSADTATLSGKYLRRIDTTGLSGYVNNRAAKAFSKNPQSGYSIVDLHYGIMRGLGLATIGPTGTQTYDVASGSSAGDTTITLVSNVSHESAVPIIVNELITYQGTDGYWYTAKCASVASNVITVAAPLEAAISAGATKVTNFFDNESHPNAYGYTAIADYSIRTIKTQYKVDTRFQLDTVLNSGIKAIESSNTINNPGSSTVLANTITSPTGLTDGVRASFYVSSTGAYKARFVINTLGHNVKIHLTYNGISIDTIINHNEPSLFELPFWVSANAATVSLTMAAVTNGDNFIVNQDVPVLKVTGLSPNLNSGTHVLLGDSWFAQYYLALRLTTRLSGANIINQGVGGNTAQNLIDRFYTDVAPYNPSVVWVVVGTNDYFGGVSNDQFSNNINKLKSLCASIGAHLIIYTSSVGSAEITPSNFTRSREYANWAKYYDETLGSQFVPYENPLRDVNLGTKKLITYGGVNISGTGTDGRLSYNSSLGVIQTGKTGSSRDYSLLTPAGSEILSNPTGTQNIVVAGSVTAAGATLTNNLLLNSDNIYIIPNRSSSSYDAATVFRTAGVNNWQFGLKSGSTDFVFRNLNTSTDAISVDYTTNKVSLDATLASGSTAAAPTNPNEVARLADVTASTGFLKGSTFLAQTYEIAPTTGQTVAPTKNFKSIIRPTGSLAALTIQLPSSPSAGDIIWITITQPITTISYTNGTASTAPTTLAARDEFSLVYSSVTGEWH